MSAKRTIGIISDAFAGSGLQHAIALNKKFNVQVYACLYGAKSFMFKDSINLGELHKNLKVVNDNTTWVGDAKFKIEKDVCLNQMLKECDMFFFDYNSGMQNKIASFLRKQGALVIGPTDQTSLLEDDREAGKEIATKIGLHCSSKRAWVTTEEQALKELKKFKNSRVVLKGQVHTLMPVSYEEAVSFVQNATFEFFGVDRGLMIEEFVIGTEVCIESYFDGESFVEFALIDKEHKGMFPNNEGRVLIGEAGTSILVVDMQKHLFIKYLFERLATHLDDNYVGFISMNTIIDDKGNVNFLEFTTRPGYPTEHIIAKVLEKQYADFLFALVTRDYTAMKKIKDKLLSSLHIESTTIFEHGFAAAYTLLLHGKFISVTPPQPQVMLSKYAETCFAPMTSRYSKGKWYSKMADRAGILVSSGLSQLAARYRLKKAAQETSCWGHATRIPENTDTSYVDLKQALRLLNHKG